MSGHTPGPWLVHGAMLGHRGDVFSPTAKQVTDCHHIARCFAPKPAKMPACDLQAIQVERDAIAIIEANARLIAAAPDMLTELEAAAVAMEEASKLLFAKGLQGTASIILAHRDRALAAIAKAQGLSTPLDTGRGE